MGLDPHILEAHQALCEKTGADACLVVYRGKIVQEWYSPRYHLPIYAMSSTKSVTGILTGMLLDDGKIESVDEPVCTYIPEWCTGDKGQVTLRHLLSMTSGLKNMREDGVGSVSNKNAFVIDLPLTYEPGTQWAYSNEGVQLLSPILDQAAGEPIQDYARRRLFEPLGMLDTRLHLDGEGHAWTHADMETTLRDFARIGLLMHNRGKWEGQQIVSESWVAQSTIASQELAPDYGLLWWLIDDPQGFSAQGYLDTDLYIFPERDLVIARMQSAPSDSSEGDYETEAMELIKQLTNK
jgi:CubicO group peptidase (beta-lactamase class C family)